MADILTGLVSWWKFDEGSGSIAIDSSGSGNTGSLVNSPSYVSGKIGPYAISLVAASSQEVTTTISQGNISPFTISCWFNTTSSAGNKMIGLEDAQTGTGASSFDRQLYVGTNGDVFFGVYDTDFRIIQSPSSYNDGNWHMATGTSDGTNIVLYVDGVNQGILAGHGYTGYTLSYWRIGGYHLTGWTNGNNGYFNGELDDVRVYNRSLSQNDVTALFQYTGASSNGSYRTLLGVGV